VLSAGIVFQSELNNLQKRPKLIEKHKRNSIFWRFFKIYSILADKQRLKPKTSNSLKFSASFNTHLAPRGGDSSGDITGFYVLF